MISFPPPFSFSPAQQHAARLDAHMRAALRAEQVRKAATRQGACIIGWLAKQHHGICCCRYQRGGHAVAPAPMVLMYDVSIMFSSLSIRGLAGQDVVEMQLLKAVKIWVRQSGWSQLSM